MINTRLTLPSGAYADTYIMDSEINYREYRKRPAILVAPGGAYAVHATKESEPVAIQFMQMGYQVFVLKYSVGSDRSRPEKGIIKSAVYPLQAVEMLEALHIVKEHADEWNIDKNRIFLMGFSAGGHLASTVSTHFDSGKSGTTDRLEQYSSRPDFQILFYPVISMTAGLTHSGSREALLGKNPSAEAIAQYSNEQHVTAKTPPALLFHSDDDTVVPSMNSVVFYQALKKNKVPAVLYIFDKGGHGWGMRNNFEYHNQWTNLLANWLKKI